jgi:tryptophanyl-tRNA synthetase
MEDQFGLKKLTNDDYLKLSFLPKNLIKLIDCHKGLEDLNFDKDFFLYTGRGPSNGSFHIGHLPSLHLILELQKKSKDKIFFMISDDEKIFRDKINKNEMEKNVNNTIHQLNKIGFNDNNTEFHINSKGMTKEFYEIFMQLVSLRNVNHMDNLFGEKTNIGEYFYPFIQIAPCFLKKNSQCIVIAGKDQDPFFRLARDLAKRLNFNPPIIIYVKSVMGLDGNDKMSTSVPSSLPIFIDDNEKTIKDKINKIKLIGAGTLDELFEKGADLEIDIPFKLIEIFEDNEEIINLIKICYTKGLNTESDYDISNCKKAQSIFYDNELLQRDNKLMMTSGGIRKYLFKVIKKLINHS